MKNFIPAFIIACCICNFLAAQESPKTSKELKEKTFKNYVNKIEGEISMEPKERVTTFSGSMLNQFFESEITSFFTNTKDLSIESFFLSTDTNEGTLTIGASIDFKEIPDLLRKEKSLTSDFYKLKNVATLYVKSNINNNFASLTKKNSETDKFELNSGLGFGFKHTYLGNGAIRFNKSDAYRFRRIRKTHIKKKINKAIDSYLKDDFVKEKEKKVLEKKIKYLNSQDINYSISNFDIESINFEDANIPEDKIEEKIIKKKYYELLQQIIDEEIVLLKKDTLYNGYNTWWWSNEIFIPITSKKVNISPDNTTAPTSENFKDWRVSSGLNFLFGDSSNNLMNLSVLGSAFNNNNFLAQNISSKSFQNIDSTTEEFQVLGTSNKVFIGNYDKFTSLSIKAEAGFLFKSTVGISGSFERTFDKFDVTNWKLAIPFSLKDKDEKPTVNFEIQWKETFGEHLVGIGVGYVFGRYIK